MKNRLLVGLLFLGLLFTAGQSQARAAPLKWEPAPLDAVVRKAAYKIAGHWFTIKCDLPRRIRAPGISSGSIVAFKPWVCREANYFTIHQAKPYSKQAFRQTVALHAIIHESTHQSGPPYIMTREEGTAYEECLEKSEESNRLKECDPRPDLEALTECKATQTMMWFAMELGASEEVARALGHAYMRYYKRNSKPGENTSDRYYARYYAHPDCYDGGPLDLAPGIGDWPNP